MLINLRNIYRPEHARQAGLTYVSIGRLEKARSEPRRQPRWAPDGRVVN